MFRSETNEGKETYTQIQLYLSDYKCSHSRTAEPDLTILRQFSKGRTAVQIAMDIPCGEVTVYRAIHRITNFLKYENKPCQPAGLQSAALKEKA